MIKAFGAKSETEGTHRLSLKPILQLESHEEMTKTYKNFRYRLDDFHDLNEVDTAGYFGTNHRMIEKHTQQFKPLKDFKVIANTIEKDYQLVKVMQTIRSIDSDRNGYVTNQELEDILKLHYKEKLGKYDLKPALVDFASQTNRLLINYG